MAAGTVLLALWFSVHLAARVYQASAESAISRRARLSAGQAQTEDLWRTRLADCYPLGRLEIPRIQLSAVVVEGTGRLPLAIGVGHLRGSAFPGNSGNVILAAHRDTFFRTLQDVRVDDVIRILTSVGTFAYKVTACTVEKPAPIDLDTTGVEPKLTLITCYPFHYLGHAPFRYVVEARRIDDARRPFSASNLPAGATLQ